MADVSNGYFVHRLVWPRGGGRPVADDTQPLPSHVIPSAFLTYFEGLYGPPTEVAVGMVDGERMRIGWVFAPPPDLGGPAGEHELELVVMPVLRDPDEPERMINFFIYQERLHQSFVDEMNQHDADSSVMTANEGSIEEEPTP